MNKEMTPEQFKAERERLKITAKQFGQLLGVSERAVFYYEHGQRKIPKPIQLLVLLYKKTRSRRLAEKDQCRAAHSNALQ